MKIVIVGGVAGRVVGAAEENQAGLGVAGGKTKKYNM